MKIYTCYFLSLRGDANSMKIWNYSNCVKSPSSLSTTNMRTMTGRPPCHFLFTVLVQSPHSKTKFARPGATSPDTHMFISTNTPTHFTHRLKANTTAIWFQECQMLSFRVQAVYTWIPRTMQAQIHVHFSNMSNEDLRFLSLPPSPFFASLGLCECNGGIGTESIQANGLA